MQNVMFDLAVGGVFGKRFDIPFPAKGQNDLINNFSWFCRHDQNAIGKKQRLFHIVSDEEQRGTGGKPGLTQLMRRAINSPISVR